MKISMFNAKKILPVILLFGCQTSWEEPTSSTKETFQSQCLPPAYMHVFNDIESISASPNDPNICAAVYYPSEPQAWSLDPTAPPPQRADGKCSCKWTSPGYCINGMTGEGPSASACNHGACDYYRSFECGYRAFGKPSNDCSYKVRYKMSPATSYASSWEYVNLKLVVSEPGCVRVLQVSFNIP